MDEIDLVAVTSVELLRSAAPLWERKGGWTTEQSYNSLERRLIYAMMRGCSVWSLGLLLPNQRVFTLRLVASPTRPGDDGEQRYIS